MHYATKELAWSFKDIIHSSHNMGINCRESSIHGRLTFLTRLYAIMPSGHKYKTIKWKSILGSGRIFLVYLCTVHMLLKPIPSKIRESVICRSGITGDPEATFSAIISISRMDSKTGLFLFENVNGLCNCCHFRFMHWPYFCVIHRGFWITPGSCWLYIRSVHWCRRFWAEEARFWSEDIHFHSPPSPTHTHLFASHDPCMNCHLNPFGQSCTSNSVATVWREGLLCSSMTAPMCEVHKRHAWMV